MNVLIVHQEAQYFAGAEKMLGYFLDGLVGSQADVTVAAVADSRTAGVIPGGSPTCWLPSNARFSPLSFWRQAQALRMAFRTKPFDVIHGWAARDWELTALTARLTRRPALGTLHDHPRASFISGARQRLMFWSAFAGLRKVVCVSDAVRRACLDARYRQDRLLVVHNGLPAASVTRTARKGAAFRLGFLGLFAERKGLKGLFQILSDLSAMTDAPWEIALAGDAQDEPGRKLVEELKARFCTASWWPQVQWCGWVKRPGEFLSSLDLLVCPSSEFDPFPTVLLEAGQAGVAVLAARVGGVSEIVEDGGTGWLFEAQAWREAAEKLKQLLASPGRARQAGQAAKKRVEGQFAIEKMVADYLRIYSDLSRNK